MTKDTQQKLHDGSFRVTQLGRHDDENFILPKPIEYRADCLRLAYDEDSKKWQDTADKWNITINSECFEYYTGTGHRKGNRPVKPQLSSVLSSLVLDSEACSMSFNDWADNFGYDNDSIKARKTYEACQENSDKLNKAGIYANDEMREFLAEY